MNLRTIIEAAQLLDVSQSRVRRAVKTGQIAHVLVGNRCLVDVDTAGDELKKVQGVPIKEICRLTGLTDSAVRRGVKEGWIPCQKPGRAMIFDPAQVMDAIQARMKQQTK